MNQTTPSEEDLKRAAYLKSIIKIKADLTVKRGKGSAESKEGDKKHDVEHHDG